MTKTIILLSGKQRSGKDTFADVATGTFNFTRIAFADSLKMEVAKSYGLTLDSLEELKNSTEEYRSLLISWARCRTLNDKNYFVEKALPLMEKKDLIVVTDFRFPKEKEIIVNKFPDAEVITVRVECDEEIRASRGKLSNGRDASETAMDQYKFDETVENNGTLKEFVHKCEYFLIESLTR